MKVQDRIIAALQEINLLGAGVPLDKDDGTLALAWFQRMVDHFQTKRLLAYTVNRALVPLVANKQTYTIGPSGADVTADRPLWMPDDIMVTPVGSAIELPVHSYTRQEWFAEPDKTRTDAYPIALLYEPSGGVVGTLTMWPIPLTAATIALPIPASLAQPLKLTTDLVYPPGYDDAWHYNLALRLCRPFGRQITQELKDSAKDALASVMRLNDDGPPPARSDAALTGRQGRYDILTNRYFV